MQKNMVEIYKGSKTDDLKGTGWKLAQKRNLLGWQNFVEGRILKLYVEIQNRLCKGGRIRSVERQSKSGRQASPKI